MAATRTNYIVIFKNESQVYGSASKDVALKSPPPDGTPPEDKRVFFITYQPDTESLSVHQVAQEEVLEGLEDDEDE